MPSIPCPFCDGGRMHEQTYAIAVRAGRRSIAAQGLRHAVCDRCGESVENRTHTAHNAAVLQAAQNQDVVASVDATLLRTLRERHDLTQRSASRLFGAGESSFAKWESGQSAMSTPTALLLRCALEVPGVMEHIAAMRGESLRHSEAPALHTARQA